MSETEIYIQNLLDELNSIAETKGTAPENMQANLDSQFQLAAEQLANAARSKVTFVPPSLMERAERMMVSNMEKGLDISYDFNKETGIFSMIIPALLPKKEKGSARWIRAAVQETLRNYVKEHEIDQLQGPYTMIVKHVYSHQRRKMRDHDNIELNVIMDSIALFLLVDDSPEYINHYYSSTKGDKDETRVTLVPNHLFQTVLDSEIEVE